MFNDFIPNISKHFLYSVLEHNFDSGIEIINAIVRLPPVPIGEFLASFTGGLYGMFSRFERI